MEAVFLGASKGIGYFTLLDLLSNNQNWKATVLLRKPDVFKDNHLIQPFIQDGRLRIVQGDATDEGDLKKLFEGRKVNLVMSSIGAAPQFGLSGIKIDQPDLCTRGSIALLHVLERLPQAVPPRVIVCSSMGIGEAHKDMPLAMRLLYSWLLNKPHQDKMSLELLFHRSSIHLSDLTSPHDIPPETLLSKQAIEGTKPNFLPEVIIVRPAFMPTEEPFDAQPGPRDIVGVEEGLRCYTIRRTDVARFVVEECLPGSGGEKWVNKCPVIGYK
ncbi:hypothetical protein I302_106654 [Kwoniella bestiolae CBS 10118]|uniref:NAD(P)-binding domain-containing protein n=1 Tax=Kwoniella bestiolae CBS 10118 TaxID=1296100 RepID=A0A1B9G0T0_9TREE|nr:hypothetical protein I302_06084 [Kwoniella bestiolae CBS 10118]OCF24623.1 hypothetical protein I302_06084 [Kwoniella bestiolae CBS 10118]